MFIYTDEDEAINGLWIKRVKIEYDSDEKLGTGYFLKLYGDFGTDEDKPNFMCYLAWIGPFDTFAEAQKELDGIDSQISTLNLYPSDEVKVEFEMDDSKDTLDKKEE